MTALVFRTPDAIFADWLACDDPYTRSSVYAVEYDDSRRLGLPPAVCQGRQVDFLAKECARLLDKGGPPSYIYRSETPRPPAPAVDRRFMFSSQEASGQRTYDYDRPAGSTVAMINRYTGGSHPAVYAVGFEQTMELVAYQITESDALVVAVRPMYGPGGFQVASIGMTPLELIGSGGARDDATLMDRLVGWVNANLMPAAARLWGSAPT